jgi:hypothetical protein
MHFVSQIILPPSEASRVTVTRVFQQPARESTNEFAFPFVISLWKRGIEGDFPGDSQISPHPPFC